MLREVNARSSNDGNGGQSSTRTSNMVNRVTRTAMMVRFINVNYSRKTRSDIPGFDPMIGDLFGQQSTSKGLIPGLGFAFGLEGGERFISESLAKGWLVTRTDHITPALFNETGLLRLDATVEPFRGLTVELYALYEDNHRTEFQYMFDGMPKTFGGSFAMSTLSLFSAFEKGKASNNYRSETFERFLAHREVIAARVQTHYTRDEHGQQLLNGDELRISSRSSDVLIPAFLAAYTGREPGEAPLTPFPDVRYLLPNWNATFNLMTMMPELQDHLRSLFLSHAYRSQYRVGSYSSFQSWVPLNEGSDLGFSRDPVTGLLRPSSPFDISSAAIVESFNPLIEVNSILHNHLNISLRLNRTRALNLNIGSHQLVETHENDVVGGLGYRLANFNRIIGSTQRDRRQASRAQIQTDNRSAKPFSNDLVLRLDVSRKVTRSLIRKIDDGFTQATSGMQSTSIRFSADYSLSRKLTLRAYYDTIIHRPLVSSISYPSATSNAGINLRFDLGAM